MSSPGDPTPHNVLPTRQEAADRAQATSFVDSIVEGTPLASKGDLDDKTAGGEPVWLSIAKGKKTIADDKFTAAGGANEQGTRTISKARAPVYAAHNVHSRLYKLRATSCKLRRLMHVRVTPYRDGPSWPFSG